MTNEADPNVTDFVLPPTPTFTNPVADGDGSYYVGRKSADPSFPYGVRLDVAWGNPVDRLLGLGYLEAFRQAGIENVRIVPNEVFQDLPTLSEQYPALRRYFYTSVERFAGRILMGGAFEVCGKKTDNIIDKCIALTSWEQGPVPRFVREVLNEFVEIWVPEHRVRDAFVQSGITAPIYVVEPVLPVVRKPVEHQAFGWLILAVEALRDEALPVVQSFVESFGRADPVCLYVATPKKNWPPLQEFLSKLRKRNDDKPMVEPVAIDWTNPDHFGQLLSVVDCIVSTDGCGGWWLPNRIAQANGIYCNPVIDLSSLEWMKMNPSEASKHNRYAKATFSLVERWQALGWTLP